MKKVWLITFFLFISLFSFEINVLAETTERFRFEKTGQAVWEIKTKDKLVALTFDDGPHPFFTPKILDILKKHNAKATFFVTGLKAEQYPSILKKELAEGHEIANHTYNHQFRDNLSPSQLSEEIQMADKAIQRITGVTPSLFRPVGGYYNESVINTAVQNHKTVIIWTWGQDSRDWNNPPASKICDTLLKGVKPGNIILFHDWHGDQFSKKCSTTKALETILDYLDKHGYKCVTMSEMLYRTTKKIPDTYHILP